MKDARTGQPLQLTGQPLALDLCCGKGGWTNGLIKAGYQVIGIDIEDMGDYQGFLLLSDVRIFDTARLKGLNFSLVVASPPCQEFSYRSFPFKKCRELAKNVPPDKTIWQSCECIAKELHCPLVLENVRGAQPYMGKAQGHYGSFYLWGDLPALLPIGRPKKGFGEGRTGGGAELYTGTNGRVKTKCQGVKKKCLGGMMKNFKADVKEWVIRNLKICPIVKAAQNQMSAKSGVPA